MTRRDRALCRRTAVLACALSGVASAAHAQVSNETRDFPIERFRWTFAGTGILGAESATLAPAGSWDAGLWIGTADDPLVLLRKQGGDTTELTALVARRTAAALLVSHAWARWELGIELPLVLAQSRGDTAPGVQGMLGSISGAGLGDVRVAPKLALLRQARHGLDLAIAASLTLPTGGSSDYRGEPSVALAPEVLASRRFGAWRAAANLGYRARRNTALLDLQVVDELFGTAALARRLGKRWEAAGGMSWATAAHSPLGSRNQAHSEGQLGVTFDAGPLDLALIGGAGLARGFGTPDWRAVLAARFHQAPRSAPADRDNDGLADAKDACPRDPEDRDGWQDGDGCPDLDNDGDGVPDAADRAPMQPEDKDGWQDDDGAPDPDDDGDGVPDAADRCARQAETANGWQDDDGCPDLADRDGDGVPDDGPAPDRCPEVPEDKDSWQDDDGCPDLDDDGDGVPDAEDRCARLVGEGQNQGCPDLDSDGDGLVDRLDNCPDRRGSLAFHGCEAPQLVRLAEGRIELLAAVTFETGRDRILPRAFLLLNNVADVILAHPELGRVTVEGHTDAMGDADDNLDLSRRRAVAVVRYLIARGVDTKRLHSEGFGEDRPIASNASNAGRAKNRRVELRTSPVRLRHHVDFPNETIESELPTPRAPQGP